MKKIFTKRSFFRVILFSNLVMLIVPLSVAAILYSNYSKALTGQAEVYHSSALKQAEQIIGERLGGIEQSLLRLTLEPQVRRFINDTVIDSERRYYLVKLSEHLNVVRTSNNYIYDLFVYYPKSELIVTTTSTSSPAVYYEQNYSQSSISYSKWLKSLSAKNTLKYENMDSVVVDSLGNKEVLALTQSVNNTGNNDAYATIVVLVNAEKIKQLLMNIAAVDSGAVYLLDEYSSPILSLGQTDMLAQLEGKSLPELGKVNVNSANQDYSIFTEKSTSSKWRLMSIVSTDHMMHEVKQTQYKYLLISVAAVLISLLIAYRSAGISYRPVKQLVAGLKQKAGYEQKEKDKPLANELEFIETFTDEIIRGRDQVKQLLKEQEPALRTNLLTQLIKGGILPGELNKYSPQSLGIDLQHRYFAILLIRIDQYPSSAWEERHYAKFVTGNVIEHLCASFGKAYITELDPDRLALLLNVPKMEEWDQLRERLIEAAVQTTEFVRQRFAIETSVGIGQFHAELNGVHISFREALQALDYQLIQGRALVVHASQLPQGTAELNYSYSLEMEMALLQAIKLGDGMKTQQLLEDIFQSNIHSEAMSLQMSKCLFFDIMSTAFKVLNQLSLPIDQIFSQQNPYDQLHECRSIAEMQTVTVHLFTAICSHIQTNQTGRAKELRRAIITYMEENYADPDLSLSKLAEVFQLNASYLSNLFKEQIGDNFMALLGQLRIDAAKTLLDNEKLTVQEIAKQVGYTNSNTFIRNFKKYTDTTPGEYREQLRKVIYELE